MDSEHASPVNLETELYYEIMRSFAANVTLFCVPTVCAQEPTRSSFSAMLNKLSSPATTN
jgi:hypothetical protein